MLVKMIVLMEDTCGNPSCSYEHGLSVYVETDHHKLLLDTGASGKFLDNAKVLGVDPAKVDTLILSHGHYDHSGGILPFLEQNKTAQVYLQKSAGGDYFHGERYIGIDKKILEHPRVHLLQGDYQIDEQLTLFSNIKGRRFFPKSNLLLSEKNSDGTLVQDEFGHEQCLAFEEVLISGCAHSGILNILDRYKELFGREPKLVVSGFHMMKKEPYDEEECAIIRGTARELTAYKDTKFYTGHCTGQPAFDMMKEIMGDQLVQIHSGNIIM